MASSPNPAPETWRHKSVPQMNEEERLAALKDWAEEKKYVRPGEGGTMTIYGAGGPSFAIASSVPQPSNPDDKWAGQYDAPVGPPSYTAAPVEEPKKSSALRKWLEKRKEKKEMKRRESAPAYTPT
ncbi:Hypothetical predicted protein [Lecanosticta acicola]|uniref:Uncharacterized protein n=1 Tax=Lecanosticta acicola TaxID=111012 RepID=A0AAI9EAF2_9PEZI|nr:Hypothetical predicted protein [Lecanosticta acicola]